VPVGIPLSWSLRRTTPDDHAQPSGALNAINPGLLDAFDSAFRGLAADVPVVVLRGADRAFSSGHDLRQAAEEDRSGPKSADEVAAGADRLHKIHAPDPGLPRARRLAGARVRDRGAERRSP